MGFEVTLLCAPPIGWALSSATLVERGEARALFAIGHGPRSIVRSGMLPALGFALLAGLAALAAGTEAAAPGRLARSLVDQARRSCDGGSPRATDVPFVGVTWLCFREAPRLTGSLPGGGGSFTSSDLAISDDLRSLHFSDMSLLLGGGGSVRVHVEQADIRGLSPWGRASRLPPIWRAALMSATGMLLALLASFCVLSRPLSQQFASLLLGGAGPVAALLTLTQLEQGEHRLAVYLAVPLSGVLVLLAMNGIVGIASRRRLGLLPHDPPGARPTVRGAQRAHPK
jgi:hypothetical protein